MFRGLSASLNVFRGSEGSCLLRCMHGCPGTLPVNIAFQVDGIFYSYGYAASSVMMCFCAALPHSFTVRR